MQYASFGSFADGFVNTYLAAEEHQRRQERSKLEFDLISKEMKLKEKRAEFEEQKFLQDLKDRELKQRARLAIAQLFGQPQADPLQETLAGMEFSKAPPGSETGGAPRTAPANPLLQQALAPTPTTGLGAMPDDIRRLMPFLLLAGEDSLATKFADPYLPKRREGYTMRPGYSRYDENNRLVATAPGGAGGETVDPSLLRAIQLEPRLYPKLPAKTRELVAPYLPQLGVRVADMDFPEDEQLRSLRIAKYAAEIAAAQRTVDGTLTPGDQRKFLSGMREDIRQEPAFKDLAGARSGHTSVMVGARQANAQGDLALLNGIARLLDPGSVVRPSEFDAARRAQGLIDQIEVFAQRIAKGEILSAATRQQYVALANALMDEWERTAKTEIEQVYGRLLKGTGLSLDDVWVHPGQVRTMTPGKSLPRVGSGRYNTEAEIDAALEKIDEELRKLGVQP